MKRHKLLCGLLALLLVLSMPMFSTAFAEPTISVTPAAQTSPLPTIVFEQPTVTVQPPTDTPSPSPDLQTPTPNMATMLPDPTTELFEGATRAPVSTVDPGFLPTAAPSPEPSSAPSIQPTSALSPEPSSAPSIQPTSAPSPEPSEPISRGVDLPAVHAIVFSRVPACASEPFTVTVTTNAYTECVKLITDQGVLVAQKTGGYRVTQDERIFTFYATLGTSGERVLCVVPGNDGGDYVDEPQAMYTTLTVLARDKPNVLSFTANRMKPTTNEPILFTITTSASATRVKLIAENAKQITEKRVFTELADGRRVFAVYAALGTAGTRTITACAGDDEGYSALTRSVQIQVADIGNPAVLEVSCAKAAVGVKMPFTLNIKTTLDATYVRIYDEMGKEIYKYGTYTQIADARVFKCSFALGIVGDRVLRVRAGDALLPRDAGMTIAIKVVPPGNPAISGVRIHPTYQAPNKPIWFQVKTNIETTRLKLIDENEQLVQEITGGFSDSGDVRTWVFRRPFGKEGMRAIRIYAGDLAHYSTGNRFVNFQIAAGATYLRVTSIEPDPATRDDGESANSYAVELPLTLYVRADSDANKVFLRIHSNSSKISETLTADDVIGMDHSVFPPQKIWKITRTMPPLRQYYSNESYSAYAFAGDDVQKYMPHVVRQFSMVSKTPVIHSMRADKTSYKSLETARFTVETDQYCTDVYVTGAVKDDPNKSWSTTQFVQNGDKRVWTLDAILGNERNEQDITVHAVNRMSPREGKLALKVGNFPDTIEKNIELHLLKNERVQIAFPTTLGAEYIALYQEGFMMAEPKVRSDAYYDADGIRYFQLDFLPPQYGVMYQVVAGNEFGAGNASRLFVNVYGTGKSFTVSKVTNVSRTDYNMEVTCLWPSTRPSNIDTFSIEIYDSTGAYVGPMENQYVSASISGSDKLVIKCKTDTLAKGTYTVVVMIYYGNDTAYRASRSFAK